MDRRRFLALAGAAVLGGVPKRTASGSETAKPVGEPNFCTVFLCGDVMTGRGVDQVLPHPSAPQLFERALRSAVDYVHLAERTSGPISRPVDYAYVWGDALAELARRAPDVRIVNLETAITRADDAWPGKGVHYRMHPGNAACLTAAGIDCCVLANNHVLDWGQRGLAETLDTLHGAGIRTAGAGRDGTQAAAPAILEVPARGRVLVFAFGTGSSGIPREWAAGPGRPGVSFLADLSGRRVEEVARRIGAVKRLGDLVVASIHWGGNWGFDVPADQRRFAERLVESAGVDVVHGHSSHHVKAVQVHRGKLILYGCGDFLTDYEGIGGREEFRGDLALMYFPTLALASGRLSSLVMTPTRTRRFQIGRAPDEGVRWLVQALNREGERFDTAVERQADDTLRLQWDGSGAAC